MGADADLLKEVPLFQFLDDRERAELAARLNVVTVPMGRTIFKISDPGDALYVVQSGEVEIFFKNDTGERIVLEVAGRGDFFGELSLLDKGARSATAVATQDTETFQLTHRELETYITAHPHAAMAILAAMGRRMRVSAERLRHTASRNVNLETEDQRGPVQKVADWIAEFSGSISFLVLHVVWFGLWLVLNNQSVAASLFGREPFDAYPFGFLTMTVSLEAIFLSVFVLLSQNRQSVKDHIRSDVEYDVNLKAELEIAHLHEKVDRFTADVLARLEEIQSGIPKSR